MESLWRLLKSGPWSLTRGASDLLRAVVSRGGGGGGIFTDKPRTPAAWGDVDEGRWLRRADWPRGETTMLGEETNPKDEDEEDEAEEVAGSRGALGLESDARRPPRVG